VSDKFQLYTDRTANKTPFAMILHASGDDGKFNRVVCEVTRDRDAPQQYDRFVAIYAPIMVRALENEMGRKSEGGE
jgi:hypothetical protein